MQSVPCPVPTEHDRAQADTEGSRHLGRLPSPLESLEPSVPSVGLLVSPGPSTPPLRQKMKSNKERMLFGGGNNAALDSLTQSKPDALWSSPAQSPGRTSPVSVSLECVSNLNVANTCLAAKLDALSAKTAPGANALPVGHLAKSAAPRLLKRSTSDPMLSGGGTEALHAIPPAPDALIVECRDQAAAPHHLASLPSDLVLSGEVTDARPATTLTPEALIVEQLEIIRLVLETKSSKLLDAISKQLRGLKQQASSLGPAEITSFKADLQKLRAGGANDEDLMHMNVSEIAHDTNGISATIKPISKQIGQSKESTAPLLSGSPQFSAPASKLFEKSQRTSLKIKPLGVACLQETAVTDQAQHEQAEYVEIIEKAPHDEGDTAAPGASRRQVFPDENQMKEQIRKAISKTEYRVEHYYYDTGIFQRIARSPNFDHVTLVLIAINAIWISIEIDNNDASCLAQANFGFQLVEHIFCAYFFGELLIRFLSFRKKTDCLKDKWFVFDSALVALMVSETWIIFTINLLFPSTQPAPDLEGSGMGDTAILKMVRILRLLRCARLVRLLRSSPELIVLIRAISTAIRSVFFTFVLMLLIAYIFAIAITQLTAGSAVGDESFDTVPSSMKNLLLYACFPDLIDIFDTVGAYDIITGFVFLLFVLLISLTILNMLIGILVQVVAVVSATEKEKMIVEYVRDEVTALLKCVDTDGNELIALEEFKKILLEEKAVKFLTQVGVDVVALVEYINVIFSRDKEFEYADIINLILDLRGANQCTVKDVVDLRQWIDKELFMLRRDLLSFGINGSVCNGETGNEDGELQVSSRSTTSRRSRMKKQKRTATTTF